MPKTLWINPSYEPLGEEMHEDYEACFSVKDIAGLVRRYKQVHYRAYDKDGKLIEGKAEGFLARIIQHEIDHLNGILFLQGDSKLHVHSNSLILVSQQHKNILT